MHTEIMEPTRSNEAPASPAENDQDDAPEIQEEGASSRTADQPSVPGVEQGRTGGHRDSIGRQRAQAEVDDDKDWAPLSHWDNAGKQNLILHFTAKYCADNGFARKDGSAYKTPPSARPQELVQQTVEVRRKYKEQKGSFVWEEAEVVSYDAGHKDAQGKGAPFKLKYKDDGEELWHRLDKKMWPQRPTQLRKS